MKNIFYKLILCLSLLLSMESCSDKTSELQQETEKPQSEATQEGLSHFPEIPDADNTLTITFKANKESALYNYAGDVYIHAGIVEEGTWMYVPGEWNENLEKCRMTSKGENTWEITLSPSIREWFGSGKTPVNKIGIVIRSSDGSKKGIETDTFIEVTDTRYQGFTPAAIIEKSMPSEVKEGINIDGNNVTFVLYDKDKEGNHKDFAHIVGDFNNWTLANDETSQMYRDNANGCWWITISNLDPDKEYAFQYYIGTHEGETIRLADAYAEKILDPDNDKYIAESTYPATDRTYPANGKGIVSVFKINKNKYSWQNDFKIADKNNLIIYEIHLRDFTETSDLNGAISKLDYIQSLGANAIELMPVQEFDGNDSWGYNPCFYFALDKAYGTPDMYKRFIDECHRKGIAVIFDVVYNHATGNMPFARLYWDSSNNKTSSNNPWFNVDAPHPYSVFHDFNHESGLVRNFVKRNLKFLLEEYHIDGFRFDLTKGLTQQPSTESTASDYDASRINILKEYYDTVNETNPDAVMILEHFCCDTEEKELADYGIKLWRNANNAYCQSGMGWQENSDFSSLYTGTNHMTFGGYIGYMESHDEERTAYKALAYGNGNLKNDLHSRMASMAANTAFFLTVPGPKMIWQFGEMGYDISIEENGRTGRKPLHWEYQDDADRQNLITVYKKFASLRSAVPQLFNEECTFTWNVTTDYWETCRQLLLESIDGKKLFIIGNFTTQEQESSVAVPSGWDKYYDIIEEKNTEFRGGENITLKPHSFIAISNF
ncbi:alpha-amylase family glycosyl hydrolase [uncultured Phocaeicola sp.]|uniref:alpha-amylase family glycosyl hydrolase n=1 Tax=uncultured Phocaeicola sp. TaxID=990718 RepID=UPI0034561169